MELKVKKWIEWKEICFSGLDTANTRVAVAAVVENPYAGIDSDDLSDIFDSADYLGLEFSRRLLALIGGTAAYSYGKAAVVGSEGEFEHGKAFLMNRFVDHIRSALGGATSWVPSTCVRSEAGRVITVPTGHIRELDSDTSPLSVSLFFGDEPRSSEVVVIFAITARVRD